MLMDVPATRMAFGELVTGVVFGVLGIARCCSPRS